MNRRELTVNLYNQKMPGGRQTHDYPQGRPRALIVLNVVIVIVGFGWVFLAGRGWRWAIPATSAWVALLIVNSRLHARYVRQGLAIAIPRAEPRPQFPHGVPLAARLLRYAFFVGAASLIGFGVAPIRFEVAKVGMIASVLTIVAIGFAHLGVEIYYSQKKDAT